MMTAPITPRQAHYLTSLLDREELRDLPPLPISALTRSEASRWLAYLARRLTSPSGRAPAPSSLPLGVVVHAEALPFLTSIQRVDVVVTDPPYPNRSTLFPDDQVTGLAALYVACTIARKVVFWWNPSCVPTAPAGWRETMRYWWEKPNAPGREEVIIVWEHETSPVRPVQVLSVPAINRKTDPEWVAHPTQKPIALLTKVIASETQATDVVLDPFLGSGTTALACERLGRTWVGCEHYARYVALARQRLTQPRASRRTP
jgi:hypothetical protein